MRINRKVMRVLHIHFSKADQRDTVTKIFAERFKGKVLLEMAACISKANYDRRPKNIEQFLQLL